MAAMMMNSMTNAFSTRKTLSNQCSTSLSASLPAAAAAAASKWARLSLSSAVPAAVLLLLLLGSVAFSSCRGVAVPCNGSASASLAAAYVVCNMAAAASAAAALSVSVSLGLPVLLPMLLQVVRRVAVGGIAGVSVSMDAGATVAASANSRCWLRRLCLLRILVALVL